MRYFLMIFVLFCPFLLVASEEVVLGDIRTNTVDFFLFGDYCYYCAFMKNGDELVCRSGGFANTTDCRRIFYRDGRRQEVKVSSDAIEMLKKIRWKHLY